MQGKVNGEFRIHKDSSDPGFQRKCLKTEN